MRGESYMDRNIIMNRLGEHLLDARANGYKPLYLSLQGSQNYNLDYEHSDIDTKAMVVPTLRDVVLNNKPVSTTHVMENNEHCDLKDIRLMFENFKKQNINFLEVLFSPYYWVDERYEEEFEQLRAHAEEIAHYNENVAVKCMLGMAKEKYNVFHIHFTGTRAGSDKETITKWKNLLGEQVLIANNREEISKMISDKIVNLVSTKTNNKIEIDELETISML